MACSNVTSLPEVAGNAAIMFDPLDRKEMAARILEIATNDELRASLENAALARRTIFSARDGAVRTLAVYACAFADLYGGEA